VPGRRHRRARRACSNPDWPQSPHLATRNRGKGRLASGKSTKKLQQNIKLFGNCRRSFISIKRHVIDA
jgi:hypothetical protein